MPFYFLYLHGFNGSPNGMGAKELRAWLKNTYPGIHIDAPDLAHHSLSVLDTVSSYLDKANHKHKVVFGNSMGGLVAHILKQRREDISQAILLNPTLNFSKILESFPREHICSKTGDKIAITDEMAKGIERLIPDVAHNQNDYLLLLQKDDDICYYKDSLDILPNAYVDLQTGQGHHYDDTTKAFTSIKQFLDSQLSKY
jgi:hypothetical protein